MASAEQEIRAISGQSVLAELRAGGPGATSLAFPKNRYRLHAMVANAGYDNVMAQPYDWHGLRRGGSPFVLLQHTLSGRGNLDFEGRRFHVRAGETMLLRFPHEHRYWLARGHSWEFFWLVLNGREVMRVWREVMEQRGPLLRLSPPTVERLAEFCRAVRQGEAGSPARASAIAYAASMCVADEALAWAEAPRAGKRPTAIERVLSACHAEPSGPFDVEHLARIAGYSRYHFTRMFTAHQGMPPARYLQRRRLEEAARLLRADDTSVKAIAHRCGFADANYFAKVFQRAFGMTPSVFRRADPSQQGHG